MPTILTSCYNVPPPAHPPLTYRCLPIDLPLSTMLTCCCLPHWPLVICHVNMSLSAISTRHYLSHQPAVICHVNPPLSAMSTCLYLPCRPAFIHHVDPLLCAMLTCCYLPWWPTVICHVDPPLSATLTCRSAMLTCRYLLHGPTIICHINMSQSTMSICHCLSCRLLNTTTACPLHMPFLLHQPAPPSTSSITVMRTSWLPPIHNIINLYTLGHPTS